MARRVRSNSPGALWCLLILAMGLQTDSLFGQGSTKKQSHIVFLISEDPDNYEATRTIPIFAEKLRKENGLRTTVLQGEGERRAFHFPGLEVIGSADLVVIFCRRVALPHEQVRMLKEYLDQGKPVIGIRTAHHAFSPREEVAPSHEAWTGFPADVLGCENRGYGPTEPGTDVYVTPAGKAHSITRRIGSDKWHSNGNIYHVAPLLDKEAVILLTGNSNGKVEPVAWTRVGKRKNRIFYTSLGYPTDFDGAQFNTLLINAISWATEAAIK